MSTRTLGRVLMIATPFVLGASFAFAQITITPEASTTCSGCVGIGTTSPEQTLHIKSDNGNTMLAVEEASGAGAARKMLYLKNNGGVQCDLENTATSSTWRLVNSGIPSTFIITELGHDGPELKVDSDGDLHVLGNLYLGGAQKLSTERVLGASRMPLEELARYVAEHNDLPDSLGLKVHGEEGVSVGHMQMALLVKIEELTLYTIEQQKQIDTLREQIAALKQTNGAGR